MILGILLLVFCKPPLRVLNGHGDGIGSRTCALEQVPPTLGIAHVLEFNPDGRAKTGGQLGPSVGDRCRLINSAYLLPLLRGVVVCAE